MFKGCELYVMSKDSVEYIGRRSSTNRDNHGRSTNLDDIITKLASPVSSDRRNVPMYKTIDV